MDAMLQRHSARYIYVIPDGLKELMSDISREVIRANPENICTFIADYLDALLLTRENARVAARVIQSLAEMAQNAATFLIETDIPRDDIDQILEAIRQTFKKSIDSKQSEVSEEVEEANVVEKVLREISINPESAEIAAKIIQQAYHRFKDRKRQEESLLAGIIDWRVAARSALRLYRRSGVSNDEANRAATLIKAAYKGYYTRKLIKKLAEKVPEKSEQEEELQGDEQEDEEKEEEEHCYEATEEEILDLSVNMPLETKISFGDERKSVKINYDTVIPHVDFDDKRESFLPKDSPGASLSTDEPMPPKTSTTSSIVRYQISQVLNQAFDSLEKNILGLQNASATATGSIKINLSEDHGPTRYSLKKGSTSKNNNEHSIDPIQEEEHVHTE